MRTDRAALSRRSPRRHTQEEAIAPPQQAQTASPNSKNRPRNNAQQQRRWKPISWRELGPTDTQAEGRKRPKCGQQQSEGYAPEQEALRQARAPARGAVHQLEAQRRVLLGQRVDGAVAVRVAGRRLGLVGPRDAQLPPAAWVRLEAPMHQVGVRRHGRQKWVRGVGVLSQGKHVVLLQKVDGVSAAKSQHEAMKIKMEVRYKQRHQCSMISKPPTRACECSSRRKIEVNAPC